MGGKNTTTTQKAVNTPTGLPQMYDIWNRVQQAASTPYTPYGGQMVADLNATQRAGIQGITDAQGSAQPYFDEAAGYARTGASAIDPAAIQRYMSPYTQNVIDATRTNFAQDNKLQQNQIVGNAAAKGALGNSRLGVAQAELARGQRMAQDPLIAGMYSSAYDKALGAAQGDRSAAAQGAFTMGALAPSVQNARISGAQAQIGAGGLEQGTEQAKLTAAYNQYLQQLAFPYQQAGFLASAGLPAAGAMGGTTNQTTTAPGPSPWGQILGLGLAGAGLMTGNPMMAMGGLGGAMGGGQTGFTGNTTNAFAGQPGATLSFMGGVPYPMFRKSGGRINRNHGGRVNDRLSRFHDTVTQIRQTLRGGGAVRGYANGGDVIDLSPADYVSHGFADTQDAMNSGAFDPQGANYPGASVFAPPAIPLPRPRPVDAPYALPPIMTAQGEDDALPDDAMSFAPRPASPYALPAPQGGATMPPAAPTPFGVPASAPSGGLNPLGLSEDSRAALISAGLGMMASRSPFALSAVGEGGLHGVKTYEHRRDQRQKVESEARRLAQMADQFAKSHGLGERRLDETIRHAKTMEGMALKPQLTTIGKDEYGQDIKGIFDPRDLSTKPIPKPGGTQFTAGAEAQPVPLKPPAPPPAQISDEDTALPKTAMLVSGDDVFLQGLPPAEQKMVKAMVEGRQPPPPGKALATPYWRRMVELASTYDPGFDMGRWAARVQTRKNFATGVEGRIVRSLNTVANHIGELDEAGEALDNFKSGTFGPATKGVNSVVNWYREHQQDPKVRRFESTATAVATELEKAFRGSQTAISGIKEWRQSMKATMAKDEMREANKTLSKLLLGQLEGLAGQYSKGMGVNADPLTILEPQAAKIFQKLIGTTESDGGEKPAAKVGGAPSRPSTVPAGSQYSPSRKQWRDPSGKIYDAEGKSVQ